MPQSLMRYGDQTAPIRCYYLNKLYGFCVCAVWLFRHHTVAEVFYISHNASGVKIYQSFVRCFDADSIAQSQHRHHIHRTVIVQFLYGISVPQTYDRPTVTVRLSYDNCTMSVRVSDDGYYRAVTARAPAFVVRLILHCNVLANNLR